jgi:cytochrome b561
MGLNMGLTGSATGKYRLPAIAMHWLLAVLILFLLGLGWYMVGIPRGTPARAFYFNLHKSLGLTAAVITALQIVWHLTHAVPPLPTSMPAWEIKVSLSAHKLLYALMVLVPLFGYVSSSFSKFGVHLFGLALPHWGWEDKALRDIFVTAHSATALVLVVLLGVHVAAALKHWLIDRDQVLQRMLP